MGARGAGSRKIWCETLLCLYLWPRRWPTLCIVTPLEDIRLGFVGAVLTDFVIGDLASDMGWKLNGPFPFCMDESLLLPLLSADMEL